MKIPKKIKVAGLVYDVRTGYRFDQDTSLCGQCDHQNQEIRLSSRTSSNDKRKSDSVQETFIHELLHAVDRN